VVGGALTNKNEVNYAENTNMLIKTIIYAANVSSITCKTESTSLRKLKML